VSDLRRIVAYWRQAAEQGMPAHPTGSSRSAQAARLRHPRRHGAARRRPGSEAGGGATALQAVLDARLVRDTGRSHTSAAQAMRSGVCRQWLDSSGRPSWPVSDRTSPSRSGSGPGRRRRHKQGSYGTRSPAWTGRAARPRSPLSPPAVHRLACDASVQVVLGPPSEPLDVGRRPRWCRHRSAGR
jgi:hypothetical protein